VKSKRHQKSGEVLGKVNSCIVNFDVEGLRQACREALDEGIPPAEIFREMARGMEVIGRNYERGEYYLSELIAAGETMKEGMRIVEPHLKTADYKAAGKVLIGTVKGDLHDIGKDIVIALLKSAGFEVVDLGIDVPSEKFVEEVRRVKPDILGLSGLLTPSMMEMENVIRRLTQEGLREKVKVILGGYPIKEDFARKVGADAGVNDVALGVKICKEWIKSK
jgi:5-methyltetrahydrofolate--homocysteine methyltransferase